MQIMVKRSEVTGSISNFGHLSFPKRNQSQPKQKRPLHALQL